MTSLVSSSPSPSADRAMWTLADLVEHLGDMPLDRIRAVPPPGMATEQDALESKDRYGCLCELVDGVLVAKSMGTYESLVAVALIVRLGSFLEEHDLGCAFAPDGFVRLAMGLVRAPDVSFISWQRIEARDPRRERLWTVISDLAVEILSEGNTRAEMRRKLGEYFEAGTRLVWIIDPRTRTAEVYTSPESSTHVDQSGELDGGDLLPSFRVSLADLFRRADRAQQQP